MVVLDKIVWEQLANPIESSLVIVELRCAKEVIRFFLELENRDQAEWVSDSRFRLQASPDATVAVCVLRILGNNGHAPRSSSHTKIDCAFITVEVGVMLYK